MCLQPVIGPRWPQFLEKSSKPPLVFRDPRHIYVSSLLWLVRSLQESLKRLSPPPPPTNVLKFMPIYASHRDRIKEVPKPCCGLGRMTGGNVGHSPWAAPHYRVRKTHTCSRFRSSHPAYCLILRVGGERRGVLAPGILKPRNPRWPLPRSPLPESKELAQGQQLSLSLRVTPRVWANFSSYSLIHLTNSLPQLLPEENSLKDDVCKEGFLANDKDGGRGHQRPLTLSTWVRSYSSLKISSKGKPLLVPKAELVQSHGLCYLDSHAGII